MVTLVYGEDPFTVDRYVETTYFSKGYRNYFGTSESLIEFLNNRGLFETNPTEVRVVYNLKVNQSRVLSEVEKIIALAKGAPLKSLILVDYSKRKHLLSGKLDNLKFIDTFHEENIFKLVDAIFQNKLGYALLLIEPYLKSSSENYVLSMIFYMVKNILMFFYLPKEFSNLSSFLQGKVSTIASKSSISKTKGVIFALSEADYRVKTGSDPRIILSSLLTYIAK